MISLLYDGWFICRQLSGQSMVICTRGYVPVVYIICAVRRYLHTSRVLRLPRKNKEAGKARTQFKRKTKQGNNLAA